MKLTIRIFNHGLVIHSSHLVFQPILNHNQVHKIDITPTIEELLVDQRRRLLPPEGHEDDLDTQPHPE
ncbi:hypothetical protein ES703_101226 [subsurface metagenome]